MLASIRSCSFPLADQGTHFILKLLFVRVVNAAECVHPVPTNALEVLCCATFLKVGDVDPL